MLHKNIVHDLFVSFLRLYIMKRKVKGLMLFQRQPVFITRVLQKDSGLFLSRQRQTQMFFDTDRHRCICAPGTNVNNFRLRKRSASDV